MSRAAPSIAPEIALPQPKWNGRRYAHTNGLVRRNRKAILKWFLTRRPERWARIEVQRRRPEIERVPNGDMLAHWVGHATVLVQADGRNILTDPVWSPCCGPLGRLGPRRVAEPGISLEALPPIDVVILSHDHYDHFDPHALRWLKQAHDPLFCVPAGVGARMRRLGIGKAEERSWWETCESHGLRFTCVPARHWSGRGPGSHNKSLWCGWMVETRDSGAFYFAGDTGWWEAAFDAIGARFPEVRLAALPIGSYEPQWFMSAVHINPDEAVALRALIGAERALAIHHATFRLSEEGRDDPANRLAELLRQSDDEERFRALEHGACLAA